MPGVQAALAMLMLIRGTMCKETEMKILHGSQMCSGDKRGKKGLEVVMESPKDLKREYCIGTTPPLLFGTTICTLCSPRQRWYPQPTTEGDLS